MPRSGPVDSSLLLIRRRKELLAFVIGLMLFAAGALALARNHQRTAARRLEGAAQPGQNEAKLASSSARPSIGPAAGTSVGAYVDQRRAALKKVGTARPRTTSWAVVSFDSYREPDAVTALLSGRTLTVAAFQQRVPAQGFDPETVDLGGRRVGAMLSARAGAALAARLERERSALERLLPTVDDAAYRQVYQAEVRRLAKVIQPLRTRPATVFALVVRGSNDALFRLSKVPGVRLVDVADSEASEGSSGVFGLLPDDVKTASFGSPAP
jgi:hypothetical protein